MVSKEWSADELKTKMEAYCAASEHCETDARMRLRQWGCNAVTEDIIIDYLLKENYISDERYAKAFVHDKLLYQGWGRIKIEYMLRGKRIDYSIIQSAILTIDEADYSRILRHLIAKRLPANDKPALCRFLTQRGFTIDEINKALDHTK